MGYDARSRMSSPRPLSVSWGRPDSPSASGTRDTPKREGETFFLGKYRVISEIGRGGMASVHLARIDGPGGFHRWVAIKRIHSHLIDNEQVIDMFLDEARVVAGISHANVTQVFELGKDHETYWIAMEYLHGEPLREITRQLEERKTPMHPGLAAKIISDAAEGLHAAHEARGKNGQLLGLVHRDVTPHNLFVTYEGCTKVVDFGIALAAERLCAPTNHGQLKGKLAYMSPEQIRNEAVDRTTDIFALGIVLWELTTGQRLFRRDTDLDTLERAQACEVPRPSSIVRGYPAELEGIVLKALARRREDRFTTARELSRALQQFLIHGDALVGPEEVSQLVKTLFADRIVRREEHLTWAAEVTATRDPALPNRVEPWGGRSEDETPATDTLQDGDTRTVAVGAQPLGALIDEDTSDEEEIQTIALRLSSDQAARLRMPPPPRSAPRPPPPPAEPSAPAPSPAAQTQPPAPVLVAAPSQLAPPGMRRRETLGVLTALFFATALSVLGFAAVVRGLVWFFSSH